MISPLQPRKPRDRYAGARSMGPQFRSGMMSVRNAKPNRNPINPNLFTVEASVPFHFSGTARKRIVQKRNERGQFVHEDRTIPTPTKPDTHRRKAWWVNESE